MTNALDRLVAERVMGWEWWHACGSTHLCPPLVKQWQSFQNGFHFRPGKVGTVKPIEECYSNYAGIAVPRYSTNIADTFAVVDSLRAEGWLLTLTYIGNGWMAELLRTRGELAGAELVREHKDRLHAILLAALAVKGVSDDEVRKVMEEQP